MIKKLKHTTRDKKTSQRNGVLLIDVHHSINSNPPIFSSAYTGIPVCASICLLVTTPSLVPAQLDQQGRIASSDR